MLRAWGRIGCVGFGGPPTHIALLRALCVERERWLSAREFEDAVAACNLLPGPASTQLAIYCAWRVRGRPGALVGGIAFIGPGLLLILALAALFLAGSPPRWVKGAGSGAGAAVAAVAVQAGWSLVPASWARARAAGPTTWARARAAGPTTWGRARAAGPTTWGRARAAGPIRWARDRRAGSARWLLYLAAGAIAAATVGPWLVAVLLACGAIELGTRRLVSSGTSARGIMPVPLLAGVGAAVGGGVLLSLGWVALKVGALSYGGGFVIIPLMQGDAVGHYHWLSDGQFLNAVALGQITPGPVVHTVAAVGYAAAGVGGGLLAAAVAFAPSFAFILIGGRHFDRLRRDQRVRGFLEGAGPAAIGAILGSAIPLGLALTQPWQYAVLGGAAVILLVLRRGVVVTLVVAAAVGAIVALAGGPLPA